MCLNVHKDPCCDVIQLPTMQNNTWFYCCRVLRAVLDPAQDTVIKHTRGGKNEGRKSSKQVHR